MDVDLSTDLDDDHAAARGRSAKRATTSPTARASSRGVRHRALAEARDQLARLHRLLIKLLFWTKFADAQCGFKAITREAAQALLPHVQDGEWFFDTELLILAEKGGYRLKEVPVRWVEDPDTRVQVPAGHHQDGEPAASSSACAEAASRYDPERYVARALARRRSIAAYRTCARHARFTPELSARLTPRRRRRHLRRASGTTGRPA